MSKQSHNAHGPLTLNPMTTESKNARPFLTDLMEIRRRAREHVMKGAVTSGYEGDVNQAVEILNQALATELVCVLRYRNHSYQAEGIHAQYIATEFMAHSNEELVHADQIAKRIHQLGGDPNFNPEGLQTRAHSTYEEGSTLIQMIREDLIAERVAIDIYREMIRYFGTQDPTTRRMLEGILEQEEEHAEEMATLLATIDPSQKPATDEEPLEQESADSRESAHQGAFA